MSTDTMSTLHLDQQQLLSCIAQPHNPHAPAHWQTPQAKRGLQAYRAHAQALATNVLTAAYPLLTCMLSEQTMSHVAQAHWQQWPPAAGDVAQWGSHLASWLVQCPDLQAWPWLSDVARLEWAMKQTDTAADVLPQEAAQPQTLQLLLDHKPEAVGVVCAAGLQCVPTQWDIAHVVQLHQNHAKALPADQAQWLARIEQAPAPHHETTMHLVWRHHNTGQSRKALPGEWQAWQALQQSQSLHHALDCMPHMAPDQWLAQCWQEGLILALRALPTSMTP